jgi:hypothetical protein
MKINDMYTFLEKISFTRPSGTKEEFMCANMIADEISALKGVAIIKPFEVSSTNFKEVSLLSNDGKVYEVSGYRGSMETDM